MEDNQRLDHGRGMTIASRRPLWRRRQFSLGWPVLLQVVLAGVLWPCCQSFCHPAFDTSALLRWPGKASRRKVMWIFIQFQWPGLGLVAPSSDLALAGQLAVGAGYTCVP